MARKAKNGEVNKSQAIRDVLSQTPEIKVSEVVATLKEKGIKVTPNLVYFIKGKVQGQKGRRRKMRRQVATVMASNNGVATSGDVLSTIKKIKGLAAEVGGLKKLSALVEALS